MNALYLIRALLRNNVSNFVIEDVIDELIMTGHLPHLATFFENKLEPWEMEQIASTLRFDGQQALAEQFEIAAQEMAGLPLAIMTGLIDPF